MVFPAGCNPKLDFLDGLKAVAERANMDKDNFWLHKFRATFATGRCGLVSISALCSNGSGTPTWRAQCDYLKPSRSQHVRDKVNEVFA
ncbi:MAG: hypothetical protein WBV60_19875 [Terriglobales bacterium]